MATFMLACSLATAQQENLEYVIVDDTDPTGWLYVSDGIPPGARGDQYLFKEWQECKLTFSNGHKVERAMVNYHAIENRLEVMTRNGVKYLPLDRIKQVSQLAHPRGIFTVTDKVGKADTKALVEEIYRGEKWQILVWDKVEKSNPSYNEKLGVGDNNVRYQRKRKLYLTDGKKYVEIKGSQAKRIKVLKETLRSSRIEKICKQEKLDLRQTGDLTQLLKLATKA